LKTKFLITGILLLTGLFYPFLVNNNVSIVKRNRAKAIVKFLDIVADEIYQKEFYVNPFKDIKGDQIVPAELKNDDLLNTEIRLKYASSLNLKNYKLVSESADLAYKIFNQEEQALKKHEVLIKLLKEWISEQDTNQLIKNDIYRLEHNISFDHSVFYPNLPKYRPDWIYEPERRMLLSELKYYGSDIYRIYKNKNPGLKLSNMTELEMYGQKPIDCIRYLLLCMTQTSGENYYRTGIGMNGRKFGEYMCNNGFETIFIAYNTTSREKKFEYNREYNHPSYVAEFIPKIQLGKNFVSIKELGYYVGIDYMVTEKDLKRKAFKDFIGSVSGFVLIEESHHVGFLRKGKLLDANRNNVPLYKPVFGCADFIDAFTRLDDSICYYQSAVIFLPKGTVNDFLTRNGERFEKDLCDEEKDLMIDSLSNKFKLWQKDSRTK
jgi:hypothetical protein